jgi:hypothetical protein
MFVPVAIETFGALGDEATAFLTELGRRIAAVTLDRRSTAFLMQRISVALQRGNAACIHHSIQRVFEFSIYYVVFIKQSYRILENLYMHFQRNGTTFIASITQCIVGMAIRRVDN